jgi:hypothetical protein
MRGEASHFVQRKNVCEGRDLIALPLPYAQSL